MASITLSSCDSGSVNPEEILEGQEQEQNHEQEQNEITTKVMDYKPLNAISLDETEKIYVHGLNDFAFSLLNSVENRYSGNNAVISPWSLSTVLAMTLNGADGITRSQIANVMGFGDADDDMVNDFVGKILTGAADIDSDVEVVQVNGLFKREGVSPKEAFARELESHYNAEINDLSDNAVSEINSWVSEKTEGKISEMISDGDIDKNGKAFLVNATYFNGLWRNPFDAAETERRCFTRSTGDEGSVETMRDNGTYLYSENDAYSAIQIPYGNEGWNLIALLPAEGKSVADIACNLDAEKWETILNSLKNCHVDLYLPKFSTNFKIGYREMLYNMGMSSMFLPTADFSRMFDTELIVEDIFQANAIDVNEEGTEAKVVTVEEFIATSLPGDEMEVPVKEFKALRPFIYIIADSTTGTIWFTGIYNGAE